MSLPQRPVTFRTIRLYVTLVILTVHSCFTLASDYASLNTGGHQTGPPSHVQYRRGAFSPWKGKRTFSPWAGKRDFDLDSEEKRAFSPWSGKRSADFEEEKRKFTPWAEKRALEFEEEKRKFTPWAGKRSDDEDDDAMSKRKFTPWAGKRSDDTSQEDKRKFAPWAGKRSEVDSDEKRKFSPWSGKRSSLEEEKRKFSPWSGKRSLSYEDFNDIEEKRAFSPWAGKRAFQPWAGKRAFNSWAGKRNAEELDPELLSDFSEEDTDDKRGFSPWKGKRNNWDLSDEDVRAVLHHITKRSVDNKEQADVNNVHGSKDFSGQSPSDKQPNLSDEENPLTHRQFPIRNTRSNTGHKPEFAFWGSRSGVPEVLDHDALHHLSKRSSDSQKNAKKFNPWAGKRSLLWAPKENDELSWDNYEIDPSELFNSDSSQKRAAAAFPPWAGSRIFSRSFDDYDKSIFSAVRRGFSPWAGKRKAFQPWAG